MLLSLIVPFYKSEFYICECLDSALREISGECELILVNDGSPDRSVELIHERYESHIRNHRISLINIDNSGPGAARNVGVRAAKGDYVGFLDSDDILLPGYFEQAIEVLNRNSSDLIQFHCKRFSDIDSIDKEPVLKSHNASGEFMLNDVRNEIFAIGSWFPFTRIYRREILQEHPFAEGVFYEDLMTIPFVFMANHKITLLDECLIGYRVNPSSTTSNHTPEHARSLLKFLMQISSLEPTVPLDILKIKVARSLSYFCSGLKLKNFPINEVIGVIKSTRRAGEVKRYLMKPDWLIFQFPELYFLADRVRLGFRNRRSLFAMFITYG